VEFIQLLEYNLIGKTSHIKEQMDKIKEFKILNSRKNISSNSITLRSSLNENIEMEPKSFDSSDKFEEFILRNENCINNDESEKQFEYEPLITASDFDSFKNNFSKINLGSNTINNKNTFNYENQYMNNYCKFQNNFENTTKYALDSFYRENSQKNSNDG
jgi:hypothetical protein